MYIKKNAFLSLFLSLAVLLPLIHFSSAQLDDFQKNLESSIPINPKNIPESTEDFRSQYMQKEWLSILEKNKFIGILISSYKKISPYINPIFKAVLGIEPGISWIFFISLFLFLTILIGLYRIISNFTTFSKAASFIISLGLAIILGISKLIFIISSFFAKIIALATSWQARIIIFLVFFIIFLFASFYSKKFGEFLKAMRERRDKEKEVGERLKTKLERRNLEKISKDISEELED